MQHRPRAFVSMCACLIVLGSAVSAFGAGVTISPGRFTYPNQVIGLMTRPLVIQITNGSASKVNVKTIALTGAGFQLTQGIAPITLNPGDKTTYTVLFAPTVTGRASGTFTATVSSQQQPLTVTLNGTGITTTALASPSATSIAFVPVEQGQVTSQQVTVTNTGGQSFGLNSVIADPPFYTDPVPQTTIAAGASYSFNVYFSPSATGSFGDNLILDYDTLQDQAVTLSGTASTPSTVAITSFALLPAATQGALYLANLGATSGIAPYTWALPSGSVLPSGLSLSTTGSITGTLASNVAAGTYQATVQVTDSSVPPLVTTKQVSIPVGIPTGGACNNIVYNVPGGSTPITPIDALGTGNYLGSLGGLYDNGSNTRPADHDAYGVGVAQAIQPLDASGNPDPVNGKKVFLILGESNVEIEAEAIVRDAAVDPLRDPHVVVVNGGMGNEVAIKLQNPASAFWSTIINFILPNYGVTPQQVVAIFAEPNDALDTGTYPTDIAGMKTEITKEVQNFLVKFPNVKLAYLSSRTYSGYSNGVSSINPEPYAYESGFAVRYVIDDQINGDLALNFDPSKGPVLAPWISWGPYYWTDGLTVPSASGLTWSCQDVQTDGSHPVRGPASQKVANALLNVMHTDDTITPWYMAPPKK